MKYVILIQHNPHARDLWLATPAAERKVGIDAYRALHDELQTSGELIASESLADVSQTTTVQVTDSGTMTTDGPYAEAKEYLAGFFVVDVESRERAIEIAAQIPEARIAGIEVRPVMDLSAFEL
jgi:hypothetical protein